MPPLQKRPPNQPKVPKVKIPKDAKPPKAKAEPKPKPEPKVKAKAEPKSKVLPEKAEKGEKKPEKSKFSLWKRSSSRSRSVEKGEGEDANVNSLRELAEHPVFQVKERGTVGNERGKDGGFGKGMGMGIGMGMEKRRKSDELRREKPSPLNLSPVTPPPNKEHRFSISSGKSEKRGSVGSEKRGSVGSAVSVGSGKAAYVPTHAASDFLRSATAGPEEKEKGRGSLDSGGGGRSRSLDGRRGSFDGKRGSFDLAGWGREEKGGGKWGRDERGRRVMPVSPGLRRYNEDVREGRYAAGKG